MQSMHHDSYYIIVTHNKIRYLRESKSEISLPIDILVAVASTQWNLQVSALGRYLISYCDHNKSCVCVCQCLLKLS